MSVVGSFEFGVVGGGIVGLAVAARLSQFGSVVLLEQHRGTIQETSSRNSGVVHAGLYYNPTFKKTSLCMEGNRAIWNLHKKFPDTIEAKPCGKWIGAVDDSEVVRLQSIARHMDSLGIPYRWLSKTEMAAEEPHVKFQEAILSPRTGIIDVHSLSRFYVDVVQRQEESLIALQTRLVAAAQDADMAWKLSFVNEGDRSVSTVACRKVVFSMGLHTEHFWRNGGIRSHSGAHLQFNESCKLHFCRGRYVGYRDSKYLNRLVYPCPLPNLKGLGVHSVIDMNGGLRFGPDAQYVDRSDDLTILDDPTFLDDMFEAAKKFLPSIDRAKMFVDFAGMRPKLSADGEAARDFHIEELHGVEGAAMLAGIESPGLTASPAIADHVAELLIGPTTALVPSLWS